MKILGKGEFKAKASFEVYRASKSAVAAIEKAGGSVKTLAPAAASRGMTPGARGGIFVAAGPYDANGAP